MELTRRLGDRDILTDLRRLRTGGGWATGAGNGAVGEHDLLGPRHTDTDPNGPAEGAIIVGDATPQWGILLHPAAAGYAMVTSATTWLIDQTPDWTGLHTYYDGLRAEFRACHFSMPESHGFGGTTYIAPCAGLRSYLVIA